jgi:ribosome biogenesis GTPase A
MFDSIQIHWYPGHIAKAEKELFAKVKLIDFILELRDARIPLTSSHDKIISQIDKPKICILSKIDLADPAKTKQFKQDIIQTNNYHYVSALNSKQNLPNDFKNALDQLADQVLTKFKAKGIRNRPARVMILGYPNIGKSTFINRLAASKKAKVENKPGVTRQQQWISVKSKHQVRLLDTPGIILSELMSNQQGIKLAMCNCVSPNTYDIPEIAKYGLCLLEKAKPGLIQDYYNLDFNLSEYYAEQLGELESEGRTSAATKSNKLLISDPFLEVLTKIAISRNWLRKSSGGNQTLDTDRAAHKFLNDFRAGNLGRISLD